MTKSEKQAKGPLLTFDLVGPMAHFRKFYTNSSSLSYAIPPRTVLMGLIAALLGLERDSYYEKLSMERARLGVALRSPVRTVMQTVNYLATDDNDWHGMKRRTQIPLELVLPRPPERFVRYRLYFMHSDSSITYRLYRQLEQGEYCYPLYLGLTECPAWVECPNLFEQIEWVRDSKEPLLIATAILVPRLSGPPLLERLEGHRLFKDRMPLDFLPDRKLKRVADVLWEAEGRPISVRVTGEVFRLSGEEAYGVFLEI